MEYLTQIKNIPLLIL